jgi:hypothetical protein
MKYGVLVDFVIVDGVIILIDSEAMTTFIEFVFPKRC